MFFSQVNKWGCHTPGGSSVSPVPVWCPSPQHQHPADGPKSSPSSPPSFSPYSFNPQVFTEQLRCAGHGSRRWGHSSEQDRPHLCPCQISIPPITFSVSLMPVASPPTTLSRATSVCCLDSRNALHSILQPERVLKHTFDHQRPPAASRCPQNKIETHHAPARLFCPCNWGRPFLSLNVCPGCSLHLASFS